MSLQTAIEISSKLYQCRDQQVFLAGVDKFIAATKHWKPVFDAAMKKNSCNEIEALHELLKRSNEKQLDHDGMLAHLLCAVACELSEPKFLTDEVQLDGETSQK